MTTAAFRDNLRLLVYVVLALAIFAGLISGVTYGCDVHGNSRAHIGVVRARERAEQQFYLLCTARYRIGVLTSGCAR